MKMIRTSLKIILVLLLVSCSANRNHINAVNDPIVYNSGNEFSIFTYNIKAISEKDDNQTEGFLDYLNKQQYDFILLQELFNEETRDKILRGIDLDHYQSVIPRIDYEDFPHNLYQDSGLFILSRFKQIDLSEIIFGDGIYHTRGAVHRLLNKEVSVSQDFLSNKSVAGALYQLNDSTKLFLFTTHIQALGTKTHKRLQLIQIKKFIFTAVQNVLSKNIINSSDNLAVILAGDFNTDAYDEYNFEWLRKNLGYPIDLHKKFNQNKKEYTMSFSIFNITKRFDYIFSYNNLNDIKLKKLKVNSINTTDILSQENESISDHLAIKASIRLD